MASRIGVASVASAASRGRSGDRRGEQRQAGLLDLVGVAVDADGAGLGEQVGGTDGRARLEHQPLLVVDVGVAVVVDPAQVDPLLVRRQPGRQRAHRQAADARGRGGRRGCCRPCARRCGRPPTSIGMPFQCVTRAPAMRWIGPGVEHPLGEQVAGLAAVPHLLDEERQPRHLGAERAAAGGSRCAGRAAS